MDAEYLAFVDEIGRTRDGEFMYRLDFTYDTESVWGDYFNIVPSVIIPDLQPETNCLSHFCKIISKYELFTAKRNNCFSMQDCIDGIIALCFSNITEEHYEIDKNPLILSFGETIDSVMEKLKGCGIEPFEMKEVQKDGDDIINNAIQNLDDEDDLDPEEF